MDSVFCGINFTKSVKHMAAYFLNDDDLPVVARAMMVPAICPLSVLMFKQKYETMSPLATYIHCSSHQLNLVISHSWKFVM